MNFKYFDVYRDEKQILAYNLSFKKCHVGLESSKPNSGPKNNTFWFYEDEKHTKNYAGANFELFDIYWDKKYFSQKSFFRERRLPNFKVKVRRKTWPTKERPPVEVLNQTQNLFDFGFLYIIWVHRENNLIKFLL